jgi:hypothetical protein
LLRAAKIIVSKESLPEDLFSLTDSELDIIFGSQLITKTIIQTIKDYTAEGGDLENILIITNVTDEMWYDREDEDGELRKLFASARIIIGDNPDFDDPDLVSLNTILDLEEEEIEEMLSSIILRDSIANKLIEYIADTPLVVNLTLEDEGWEDEIKALINAIKILLGDDADLDTFDLDPNVILDLTTGDTGESSDDLSDILASQIITDTIIATIRDLGEPTEGGEVSLIVSLDADDPRWFDQEEEPGEIRILVRAIKLLLDEEDDITSPDAINIDKIRTLSEDKINLLSKSYIIVDTAIDSIETMTEDGGSLNGLIYLPEISHNAYYGEDGEFKHCILAVQSMLNENISEEEGIEDLETISLTSLSNNKDKIIESKIIKETIIKNIELEAGKEGSVLRIPLELDRTQPGYQESSWDIEIPKLLDAIIIVVGEEGSISEISFDQDTLLDLNDEDISTITASTLIAYTAVKTIEDERNNEDSYIYLPDKLNPDKGTYDEELWYGEDGELAKALKALRELGLATMDANIDFQPLFDEVNGDQEEVILASMVVEATIINKLQTEADSGNLKGVLYIPENTNWYKTEDDDGELRKFLRSIDLILGEEGDLNDSEVNISLSSLTGENQEDILKSEIVKETIIRNVELEAEKEESVIQIPYN